MAKLNCTTPTPTVYETTLQPKWQTDPTSTINRKHSKNITMINNRWFLVDDPRKLICKLSCTILKEH